MVLATAVVQWQLQSILWHSVYVLQLLLLWQSFVAHVCSLCLQPFVEARQRKESVGFFLFWHYPSTPTGVLCVSNDLGLTTMFD